MVTITKSETNYNIPMDNMSDSSISKVITGTIKMRLLIWKRYPSVFVGVFLEMVVLIVMFSIFSSAARFAVLETMTENEMMIFFMSGIILIMFVNIALWSPINSVNNDLYNGTLEYVYSTPASRFGYYVGYGLADLIIRSVFVVPVLVTLIVLSDSGLMNSVTIIGVILMIGLMVVSMGVLVGLTAIVWKQTSAIAGILGTLFQFVAGAYFPIQSLPVAVQYVAMVLPFTYGYDLIRYYAFHGDWVPILPIPIMWIILLANAVIYYLVALKMLKKVEKKAKRQGLHLL